MNSLIQRRKRKRLSDQAWAREMAVIRQSLDRLTLFDDTMSSEERIAECEQDFWLFCKTYLPHYFTSTTQAEFHDALLALAQDEKVPGAAACPRGFAKSTIISFAFPLYSLLYEKKRFIVLCMETEEKAAMQVWRILLELQLNRRIINDFGNLVSKDAAHSDFSTELINHRRVFTRVLAMGAGQSARGLINAQYRPDLFICDDMESRALARNPKRVAKLLELILADYLLCLAAQNATFLIVGTVICVGSMLDQILKAEGDESGARFHRLKARGIETDAKGNEYSTWPEVHSLEKLHNLRIDLGPTKFSAEIQNDPQEDEGKFKGSWFKLHWDLLPILWKTCEIILQVDPSYSDTGDNKAMDLGIRYRHTNKAPDFGKWKLANGTIVPEGDYTIHLELFNRKCSIDEMIVTIYSINRRWKPKKIRVDGTYAQKIIFEREFSRYESNLEYGRLPLKFIDLTESKHDRILAMESPLERGLHIWPMPTRDYEATKFQFTHYGEQGINDDGPDVVAALDEYLKPRKRKAKLFT